MSAATEATGYLPRFVIRYPHARLNHYGRIANGHYFALCGMVPRWHRGAERVDGDVTCRSCLSGKRRWAVR